MSQYQVKSRNIYFVKFKFGILRLLLSLDRLVMVILQNGCHPWRQRLSGELLPRLAGGVRSRILVLTAHPKAPAKERYPVEVQCLTRELPQPHSLNVNLDFVGQLTMANSDCPTSLTRRIMAPLRNCINRASDVSGRTLPTNNLRLILSLGMNDDIPWKKAGTIGIGFGTIFFQGINPGTVFPSERSTMACS
jgi:hypothetical protein